MREKSVKLIFPSDVILADTFDNDTNTAIASASKVRWLRTLGGSSHFDLNESQRMSMDEDGGGGGGPRRREWKGREVVILANKLEGDAWATKLDSSVMDHLANISRIGFGEAIPISAEHGEGLADIAAIIEAMTARKRQSLGLPLMNHHDDDDVENEKMKRKELLN